MATHNDLKWLTRFSVNITSNSNKVYANGCQQLEVSVSVTPKAGAELTDEQMNSIRLVIQDDDGVYQELSGELSASTERDIRFEYYGASGTAPSPLMDGGRARRKFYVSSIRPGGSLDKIYAVIKKDQDTTYGSYTSFFNSSVTVESIAPLRLRKQDMLFTVKDAYGESIHSSSGILNDTADFNLWTLSLPNGLRIVSSIPYGVPTEQVYFQTYRDVTPWHYYLTVNNDASGINRRYTTYMHYAFDVGPAFYFDDHGAHRGQVRINDVAGTMSFLRVALTTTTNTPVQFTETSRWELLDHLGNSHRIEMIQADDPNKLDFIVH